ncbi:response regulator [Pendulispora albinea]|uniref:Response regulator n=1 Tax=Pendulispora albinea TaxID=2741071 RepID=A0ABZ2M695_9BACT
MANEEKKPLGSILLARKLISPEVLSQALRDQRQSGSGGGSGMPLASFLVERGIVREEDALRALSEQFGVPGIELRQLAILLEHVTIIPRELAESQLILPVLVRGERLFVATANPADKRGIDELEFVTGKKVYAYVALAYPLRRTIAAAYGARVAGESYYLGPRVPRETLVRLGIAPAVPVPPIPAPPPPLPSSPQVSAGAGSGGAPPAPPLPARARQTSPRAFEPPAPPERLAPTTEPDVVAADEAPPVVVDDAMQRVSSNAQLSTMEFGLMSPDASRVDEPPPAHIELPPMGDDEAAPSTLARPATNHSDASGGAPHPNAKPGASSGGPAAKTILVVDDEEEIRFMLRRVLQERGYRVIEADRGFMALRTVKEQVPDLIVLDAMLPELHGFDIARRIRGSEKYGAIPIVMVSAVYRGWRIAQDLKDNYGIAAYIEKPFRIHEVVDAVSRALTERDTRRSVHPERGVEAMSADAEKMLEQGVAAYRAGHIDDAIASLRRGIEIDPLAYRLHFHLALLYGKKGAIYEGIHELERAIELHPKNFAALKNLAVLYEKAGFRHKAVEVWERCIQVAPDTETRAQVKERLMNLL